MKIKFENMFNDSMYNLSKDCHSNQQYAKGLLVGFVGGLMAMDFKFEDCMQIIKTSKYAKDFDMSFFPDCWIEPYNKA
jgi:hypothetical protein